MRFLTGNNTSAALHVPLCEWYVLRRSQSNTLTLAEVDQHLVRRPDYVLYRLLIERQERSVFNLPPDVRGGVELVFRSMTDAANSPEVDIKWTAFALVSYYVMRACQVDEAERWIRMPSLHSKTPIPEGDRVRDTDLRRMVTWLESREAKFARNTTAIPEHSLVDNRRQSLPRESLVSAERLLLLALGRISIFLGKAILDGSTELDERKVTSDVVRLLNLANGRWHPGQAVFLQNLHHYRMGYGSNYFASCYLPFDIARYGQWLATALGLLGERLRWISASYSLLFMYSGIQHSERSYRNADTLRKQRYGSALLVAINSTYQRAKLARRLVMVGALSASYLAVGNAVGWATKAPNSTRVRRSKKLKLMAKLAGCIVDGEAADHDFSELAKKLDPRDDVFEDDSAYFRALKRELANHQSDFAVPMPSLVGRNAAAVSADPSLRTVAVALNFSLRPEFLEAAWLDILSAGVICLTPGRGKSGSDLAALLANQAETFRAFADATMVSGVAALAQQLQTRGLLATSVFNTASAVLEFAALLVEWLERPYMADMAIRTDWQRALGDVYSALDSAQRTTIDLEGRLLILSALSHVTAAAMKDLNESQADRLEQTVYEEWNASLSSFAESTTTSNLRISSTDLEMLFHRQHTRGRCSSGFVQIVLSSDGKVATLLVARLQRSVIAFREVVLPFLPTPHESLSYQSWHDIVVEVMSYNFFSNVSGHLHDYSASPLGHPSVGELWTQTRDILKELGDGVPEQLWIVPDAGLAGIPWQLVAMSASDQASFPIVTLLHGIRWARITTDAASGQVDTGRFHDRGIQAWISAQPTPSPTLDIRAEIKAAFFGTNNDSPAMQDVQGVSLSVVFGDGMVTEGESLAETTAIEAPDQWRDVRESRLCVLLSCYSGTGKVGALGDYLSISHKLSRRTKALIAPCVEVPHTAVQQLAAEFHESFKRSFDGAAITLLDVYREAVRRDHANALFSLWGLGYEPLVWKAAY